MRIVQHQLSKLNKQQKPPERSILPREVASFPGRARRLENRRIQQQPLQRCASIYKLLQAPKSRNPVSNLRRKKIGRELQPIFIYSLR